MAAAVRLSAAVSTAPEIDCLAGLLALADRDHAVGKLKRIVEFQTEAWTPAEPTAPVPRHVLIGILGPKGPQAMIDSGLAEVRSDGRFEILGDFGGDLGWQYKLREQRRDAGAGRAKKASRVGGRFARKEPDGDQRPAGESSGKPSGDQRPAGEPPAGDHRPTSPPDSGLSAPTSTSLSDPEPGDGLVAGVTETEDIPADMDPELAELTRALAAARDANQSNVDAKAKEALRQASLEDERRRELQSGRGGRADRKSVV